MILLVEHVSRAWCPHHVVDAMSDFAVAGCSGVGVFCARLLIRQTIAAIPGRAPILSRKDASRGNPDPEFFGIRWIKQDRMQYQSGGAGAPTVGRRMVSQASHFFPIFAAVPARRQSCRLGSVI